MALLLSGGLSYAWCLLQVVEEVYIVLIVEERGEGFALAVIVWFLGARGPGNEAALSFSAASWLHREDVKH
jgi:hypothetical protein